MGVNRRDFVKGLGAAVGLGAAAVILPSAATASAVVAVSKRRPKQLEHVRTGQYLDPRSWNELVDRVNELGEEH